jgi:hypothetical protein
MTDERRKEIFDIFKKIVLHNELFSVIITEVRKRHDLNSNEKSELINAFVLAGRASIVKMADMDIATYKGLMTYLEETIKLEKRDETTDRTTEEKKFYVLGKVHHQDDTSPIELFGDAETIEKASDLVSNIMNRSFSPTNLFVIEGVKRDISIKGVNIE